MRYHAQDDTGGGGVTYAIYFPNSTGMGHDECCQALHDLTVKWGFYFDYLPLWGSAAEQPAASS